MESISLTQAFLNVDAFSFLEGKPPFTNHIVCDPPVDSIPRLLPLAYSSIYEVGYFCFFYPISQHERLQALAQETGFLTQPWPLAWNKMDFRRNQNANPTIHLPNSSEYIMMCRKPGSVLAKAQNSCTYTAPAINVKKELRDIHAKPAELWRWIYRSIAIKSQIIFDPFAGTGSSAIAAISHGLRPIGCEIDPRSYSLLLENVQRHYIKLLAPNEIQFT